MKKMPQSININLCVCVCVYLFKYSDKTVICFGFEDSLILFKSPSEKIQINCNSQEIANNYVQSTLIQQFRGALLLEFTLFNQKKEGFID